MISCSVRTAATTTVMLVTAIVAIGSSTLANAQSGTDEQLLACDRIADAADKMVCYDAVVKGLKQAVEAPMVESSSDGPMATDTPAVIAPAAAVGAAAAASDAPARDPEPEPSSAIQSQPPPDMPVEPEAAAANATENFGLDKKNRKTKEQEKAELNTLQATIVRSWRISDDRFAVQLDNGQVWRENGGLYIGLPREGSPVEIVKGRFGGYSMKIGKINKRTPVRRTK